MCVLKSFYIIWFILTVCLTVCLKIQSKAVTGNVLEVVFTKSKDSRKIGILAENIGYCQDTGFSHFPPTHAHIHADAPTAVYILIVSVTRVFNTFALFYFFFSFSSCSSISPPSGGKWSAGVLSDPRFNQTGALPVGPGSGSRRTVARPSTRAARRSQRPWDALCCHSTTGLWTLSGNRGMTPFFKGPTNRAHLEF